MIFKIPEIIPMIEKIAIEISLLNHAAAEREPEHAKYLNIFTKSVFVKLMMMITGSAYISPEVGVKAGAEPIRILDTHLGEKILVNLKLIFSLDVYILARAPVPTFHAD